MTVAPEDKTNTRTFFFLFSWLNYTIFVWLILTHGRILDSNILVAILGLGAFFLAKKTAKLLLGTWLTGARPLTTGAHLHESV